MARKPIARELPEYDQGDDEYKSPGRKPKKPSNKVNIPIRCLSTQRIWALVNKGAEIHGLTLSNYLRLALYRILVAEDLMLEENELTDPTWDEIRLKGLV